MYQDHNQDCFEIMLSFIDFAKFKERMLNFKKSVDHDLNLINDNGSNSVSTTGSEGDNKLLRIDD